MIWEVVNPVPVEAALAISQMLGAESITVNFSIEVDSPSRKRIEEIERIAAEEGIVLHRREES